MMAVDVSGIGQQEQEENFGNVTKPVISQSSRAISPSADRYREKDKDGKNKLGLNKLENFKKNTQVNLPLSGRQSTFRLENS